MTNPKTGYHRSLLETYFSDEYKIELVEIDGDNATADSSFALKPRDNPSVAAATIAPMYRTRFKYIVQFGRGTVSFRDAYKSNFNRVNGATPGQRRRIAERYSDFEERMRKVQAQMIFDAERK
mmetsp:Transcript_36966/g.88436  ORF Transcript_36966/g.88436 Transcript_36966/m.88436 type:complete len:123 (-) Transcript_36966:359-727(-)